MLKYLRIEHDTIPPDYLAALMNSKGESIIDSATQRPHMININADDDASNVPLDRRQQCTKCQLPTS